MKIAFCNPGHCRCAFAVLQIVLLTGCGSFEFGNYTAPEVRGRLLAADTGLPLAGANVSRVLPEQTRKGALSEKGVQFLEQTWTVKTDAAGWFVYPSRSYFLVFQRAGGWSLNLSLQKSGYLALQTNLMSEKITGTLADGKPLVELGDILLQPKIR